MRSWTELEIKEYRDLLKQNGVPVIFDIEHLRRLIGIDKIKFYKILYKLEYQYREIEIPKRKKGEFRVLSVPSRNLKLIQRWILDNILYAIPCSECATGFVPLKSVVDNAFPHLRQRYIYKFDLRDFFPSIKRNRVYFLFRDLGYTKELSNALATLCSFNNALPQGSPTSPYIANLLCKRLDKRIKTFCDKHNFSYTRYADDITISGDRTIIHYKLLFKKIIEDSGFIFNSEKSKLIREGQQKLVTGVVVNQKMTISRNYVRRLKQELYFINKYGLENHIRYINFSSPSGEYIKELKGKIDYINMIDKKLGKQLIQMFEKMLQ